MGSEAHPGGRRLRERLLSRSFIYRGESSSVWSLKVQDQELTIRSLAAGVLIILIHRELSVCIYDRDVPYHIDILAAGAAERLQISNAQLSRKKGEGSQGKLRRPSPPIAASLCSRMQVPQAGPGTYRRLIVMSYR